MTLLTLVGAAHADVERERHAMSVEELVQQHGRAPEQDALLPEIERFKAASLSLREALSIAQNRHAGSRVVDISFDGETDVAAYQVRTNRKDRLWQDVIDARTGKTIGAEAVTSIDSLERPDRELLVRLRGVRQELSDAVIVAERSTAGKAIAAGLWMDQGRLQFVVVCVSGGDLKQVLLEPPAAVANPKN